MLVNASFVCNWSTTHMCTHTHTHRHTCTHENRSTHTLRNTFTYYTCTGHRNVITTILFTDDGCFTSNRQTHAFLSMTETNSTITISSRAVTDKMMRARLQCTQSHVNACHSTSESFLRIYIFFIKSEIPKLTAQMSTAQPKCNTTCVSS